MKKVFALIALFCATSMSSFAQQADMPTIIVFPDDIWMNDHGYHPEIIRLGLPDTQFVEHGTVDELQHIVGLDAEAIIKAIKGI